MEMEMEQTTLVLLPAPLMGHIFATLEFGVRLLNLRRNICIHVLLITMPTLPPDDSHIQTLIAAQPRLKVSKLPMVEQPNNSHKSGLIRFCDGVASHSNHVRNSISEIVAASADHGFRVAGVLMDLLILSMVPVVNEFSLSPYVLLTGSAGFLRFLQFLAASHGEGCSPYNFSDPDCNVPGFRNPVPVNVLPFFCLHNEEDLTLMINLSRSLNHVKGLIVNTFEELDEFPLNSPSGGISPTEWAVGPVINFHGFPTSSEEDSKMGRVMEWLEEQPDASVVFICLGSRGGGGLITASQVEEIAKGLEQSKQRFLWQMKIPMKDGKTAEHALPEGFKERTNGRGMIYAGWVKQVDVLGHRAIGGFVSHCGWNSTLESIWYGVPMATLPISGEQQLNAFTLVKEMGMAVELKMEYRPGFCHVSANEVERAVVEVMDKESEVRKKVTQMSIAARKAVSKGGSSSCSLAQFADSLNVF